MKFFDPLVNRHSVSACILHKSFDRGLAEFGGATQRDFIFAKQLEGDQFGGFARQPAPLIEFRDRDKIERQLHAKRAHESIIAHLS